jgi:hypothetical protein
VFDTNKTDERTEPAHLAKVDEQAGYHRVASSVNKYRPSNGLPTKESTLLTSPQAFGMTMLS